MRYLVLTRGVPASGKSTWIKQNGLDKYALEVDAIRTMIQSPEIDIDGNDYITQKNDNRVWNLLREMMEDRMKRGEFVIINGTHTRGKRIKEYSAVAKKYRYRIIVVDFTGISIETVLKQNRYRDPYERVPEKAIHLMYERLKTDNIPSVVDKVLNPDEWGELEKSIKFDFNEYDKIHVLGDIHGCVEPLKEYFDEYPYNFDDYYIFSGDYFDRGIQNTEVFLFLEDMMKYRNVLFLTGNHELHLVNYVNNEYSLEAEGVNFPVHFRETMKQLRLNGIDGKRIKKFTDKLGQLAYFSYKGADYLVTHGGIPVLPTIYTPTNYFIKGVGEYEDSEEVRATFDLKTENTIQIHGHRNIFEKPIVVKDSKVYNINGTQEFGGHFRALQITEDGIQDVYINNSVYDTELTKSEAKVIDSIENPFEYFKEAKDINMKELDNGIFAINFANSVFHKKTWNDQNIKARGLFVTEDNKVVARSYNKFFNWNERSETRKSSLYKKVKFPVHVYEKYNGFLGIMSVYKGGWFVASKSTNKGNFAEMFDQIVSKYKSTMLKTFIEDNNVSLVFEVIHPEKDPHIVEYGEPKIILLDVIYNEFEFKKFNDFEAKQTAEVFGFEYKKLDTLINTYGELMDFKKTMDNKDVFKEDIEGYVLEAADGFMWKYKGKFYSFWKHMRGLKDKLAKVLKRNKDTTELRNSLHTLEDFKVFNFMYNNPELLDKDIITVRKQFLKEN